MTEAGAVQLAAGGPVTVASLAEDLRRLGVEAGATLLVHASLSRLGWVCGGPPAVVEALLAALGPAGTLLMPTHTSQLSDPESWRHPPVDPSWWPIIRAHMPPFDPDHTPTRGMGAIAEHFRCRRGVRRSQHPQGSFAAIGPNAATLLDDHGLDFPFGESSPLARLAELGGSVLLLGVGWDSCTSLHLAEARCTEPPPVIEEWAPVVRAGRRVEVRFRIHDSGTDLGALGRALEAGGRPLARGPAGHGEATLVSQQALLERAVEILDSGVVRCC